MSRFAQLAFTEQVQQVQAEHGSTNANRRRLEGGDGLPDALGGAEADFVRERDGFYMATVGATGWPYVQYRGGPPGYVHVIDERTLAFADVRGNRQYISTGNLRTEDRAALFFMDYAAARRLKVFGYVRVFNVDDSPEMTQWVDHPRTGGVVERVLVVRVEGISWNCPKNITRRWTEGEFGSEMELLRNRIAILEQENAQLRG